MAASKHLLLGPELWYPRCTNSGSTFPNSQSSDITVCFYINYVMPILPYTQRMGIFMTLGVEFLGRLKYWYCETLQSKSITGIYCILQPSVPLVMVYKSPHCRLRQFVGVYLHTSIKTTLWNEGPVRAWPHHNT